jgi:iron(III) transport system substrate-binding protein
MKLRALILLLLFVPTVVSAASQALIDAAKKEGNVVVYSITSRIANAAKSFEKKYGITVNAYNLKDFELIEKVSQEGKNKIYGADFIIAQDSGRVFGEIIKPGYGYSYVPETMKDIIPKKYQTPLYFSFITKAFIYNSETNTFPPVNNVWELTEKKWEKKFWFKDPLKEGVNANFLTMVTSPEVSDLLAAAYERYFGKKITFHWQSIFAGKYSKNERVGLPGCSQPLQVSRRQTVCISSRVVRWAAAACRYSQDAGTSA